MESKNEQLILQTLFEINGKMGRIEEIAKDLGDRIDLHDLQMKEFMQWKIMAGPKLECIKALEEWQRDNDETMKRLKKNNGFVDKNKDRFVAGIVGGTAVWITSNFNGILEAIKHIGSKGGG